MDRDKRSLKIAIIIRKFTFAGGSYKYAAEIARRLVERGHEVDVYAGEADGALLEGLTFHRVPTKFDFSSVLGTVEFAHNTAGMISGRRYDVVHAHERAYSQDVMTLHCFSYKGGMEKYSTVRKLDMVYLSPRSHLYLWLERRNMMTPWLVTVSEMVKEETKRLYPQVGQVEVIRPGVDASWFNPESRAQRRDEARNNLNVKEGELAVLFVGTDFRRKGLDILIPAIGPGMRLFVVGRGERFGYFRRLVRQCGASDRVAFEGWKDDVRDYYAAADVVALPSRSEAFGMSILEGMASGLPVVASPNCGVSEIVTDGENGFKVSETGEISEVLRRLAEPHLRSAIGARARKTAEDYTWDKACDKHEELYYRIAREKSAH